VERAEQALDLGSCRWMNIKPGRVGGLTPALAIHDLCRQAGVGCWVGGMLESAVGSRVAIALAMLDNFTYPPEIAASHVHYREDLATPAVELVTGPDGSPQVLAPEVPGTGAVPDPQRLEQMTIARARIAAK
ncbi:MAG TPA: enolase C-terminal domain-like protein, partial [Pirellulales bacterium]|nr:enolase C-terminal domain-like protein [Pirellulales bacterium]